MRFLLAEILRSWVLYEGRCVDLDRLENSDKPCDTGTKVSIISKDFPEFDFSTVSHDYPSKTGRWAFSQAAITQRGVDCRRWLKARPEEVIAVVSHSGFLRVGVSHRHYANADYRVFRFAENSADELIEWNLTGKNGGGMGYSRVGLAMIEPTDFPQERQEHPLGKVTQASEEITQEVPEGPR